MPAPTEVKIGCIIRDIQALSLSIDTITKDLYRERAKDSRLFTESDEIELGLCAVDIQNLGNVLERIRKSFSIKDRW